TEALAPGVDADQPRPAGQGGDQLGQIQKTHGRAMNTTSRASQQPTCTLAIRPARSRRKASVQSPGAPKSSALGQGNSHTSSPCGTSVSISPSPSAPEKAA